MAAFSITIIFKLSGPWQGTSGNKQASELADHIPELRIYNTMQQVRVPSFCKCGKAKIF